MTKDEAIARARKLLALGQSDNPHEAAMAMGRAQALLARFEIELAALGMDPTASERYAEESVRTARGENMVHWRRILLQGIARANGCEVFTTGSEVVLCGKPSDSARAIGLYRACAQEIERLARSLCVGRGRSYSNSFRMGAAVEVASSAGRATREVAEAVRRERGEAISETALVVLDTRRREAANTMTDGRHHFGAQSYGGSVGGGGYGAGRTAGRGVYGHAGTGRVSGGGGRLGSGSSE